MNAIASAFTVQYDSTNQVEWLMGLNNWNAGLLDPNGPKMQIAYQNKPNNKTYSYRNESTNIQKALASHWNKGKWQAAASQG